MRGNFKLLDNLSPDERRIFSLLQKKGFLTKNEISYLTDIKLSRLNYIMKPLEKKRLVVKESIGESSGGRKPVLYSVNLRDYYVIGIDISIMYTQIVFTNLRLEEFHEEIFYMDNTLTPEKTVEKIAGIINKAYVELRLDLLELLGVGVGSVGPLDEKEGVIKKPYNFYAPDWLNVPIKSMISEKLGAPVILENGENAAIVGEQLFGVGKSISNISYINCGVGLRTGTVSSGNLIRAINYEEEGFGHMVVDINGKKCRCGNYGCIGCYSSIHAILQRFTEELKKGRRTLIDKQIHEITYLDICNAAQEEDELSKEILRDAALILGAGLANYIKLLAPNLIILSGPLIIYSKLYYEVSVQSALMRLHPDKRNRVVFNRCGCFKEKAMAIGAATMYIEKFLKNK